MVDLRHHSTYDHPTWAGMWVTTKDSLQPFAIFKLFTSTTKLPEDMKLAKVVTLGDRIPSTKLHDHLVMWPCEITRQIKYMITPLKETFSTPNLTKWWLIITSSHHDSQITLLSRKTRIFFWKLDKNISWPLN